MKVTDALCKRTAPANIFALLLGLILLLPAAPARAQDTGMTANQRKVFSQEVRYYSDVACPPGSGSQASGSAGGAATLTGGDNVEASFNFFVSKGLGDIQAAALVGNLMAESTISINPEITNHIGAYGIAQWLGGRKAALLSKPNYNTLGTQLNHVWEELTGAYRPRVLDPLTATNDLSTATRIVLERYEIPCLPGSAACDTELNGDANKPGRLKYAQDVLSSFGTGSTGTGIGYNTSGTPAATYSSSSTGAGFCASSGGSSAGVVNSSDATGTAKTIIDKAIEYAWPYSVKGLGMDQNSDATTAYQSSSASKYTYTRALTDCTIFVATVMRDSGADPEFPIGTTTIRSYLLANEGTKYQIIYQPRFEDLQPGDILQNLKSGSSGSGSWSGHIALYLGNTTTDSGTFVGADASKYTRVPGLLPSVDSMTDGHPTSIAARLIQ